MIRSIAAAALALAAVAAPAAAEDAALDTDHGRYTLSKVDDGFIRLDTQTGEVAHCAERAVGWACLAAPEDRALLESEIARLQAENGALKQALLSHGLSLPSGAAAPAATPPVTADKQGPTLQLPSDADIDRVAAFVGRVWRRFVDAIVNAQKQVLHGG